MIDAWASRGAALAVAGGVFNILCDGFLTPGPGPGSVLGDPTTVAAALADTPATQLALATVMGCLAISTWTCATPALVRIVRPAGEGIAAAAALLHVLAVGGCVGFHMASGCLAWVGRLADPVDPQLIAPLWGVLQPCMGLLFLSLAGTLCWAAWRSAEVPRWLPFASPLVSMSVLAVPATALPEPIGLPIAMSASTAGATVWLLLLWRAAPT